MADIQGSEGDIHTSPNTEVSLEDDRRDQTKNFNSATLEIDSAKHPTAGVGEPTVEFRGTWTEADAAREKNEANLARNRPYSASMTSRRSTSSAASRTSMGTTKISSYVVGKYFSHREGAVDKAIRECTEKYVKPKVDGEVQGAWLLTEIDHWDNEYEVLLMLTDFSIIVIRYDFIKETCSNYRRIVFQIISSVTIGDLVYPEKSLMMPRGNGGVRVRWASDAELSFGQRWNPWCTSIPYLTLAHHPVIYNDKERDTLLYNVDDFHEALTAALTLRPRDPSTPAARIVSEPIVIESYASVSSLIFNQSSLGFSRERNGVSF